MPPATVTIVVYHRISLPDNPDLAPALIDAYPADFEAQMRYLATHYRVVSGWDLVRALREGYTLPPRALVITFDDGYRCFQDTAWPILRRLGLPATLFVPIHYIDQPQTLFWWDAVYRALQRTAQPTVEVPGVGALPLSTPEARLAAYERLVPFIERVPEAEAARLVEALVAACAVPPNTTDHLLTWDEVAALAANGVDIGPHTRSHGILAQATPERVQAEVAGSWHDLQAHVPRPLPLFCYPNGKPHAVNAVAANAVREAGLAGAVTMVAGLNVLGRTDPYYLYRVGMVAGESLRKFAIKLSPAGRAYRRLKGLVSREAAAEFTFRET
jgi:peptidoglycan/xylan/chitin deacetylase (PgdA/CDA1 family)